MKSQASPVFDETTTSNTTGVKMPPRITNAAGKSKAKQQQTTKEIVRAMLLTLKIPNAAIKKD